MLLRLTAVVCLVFASLDLALARTEMRPPQKIFLSVGLGSFEDGRWPKLNYPGKDAVDMGTALRANFDNGVILSDVNRASSIKRDEILYALQQLAVQNQHEDDTVIVYLSTHGTLAQTLVDGRRSISKFLVAGDTEYDRVAETGLSIPLVLERFQALKSRRKALIIDSCYSGQGKAHITPAMLQFLAKQKAGALQPPVEDIDESTAVYSASAWGEEAQEDTQLQNGVYTHFLLKSFQSDLNGDGAVQLSEAHTQATALVMEYTKGAQHPSAQVEIVGQDPIILSGKLRRPGQPLLLAWRHDLRNYLVSFNGKSLGSLNKGVLSLPEGQGRLELFDPNTKQLVRSAKVDFEANETYLLESFLAEERPHSLRVHAGLSWFLQQDARERISPDPLLFTALRYQYEEAFAWADVGVSVALLQPQSESVRVDGTRLGESIGVTEEEQSLQGFRVDLNLIREQRLDWLTDSNRRWQTRWLSAAGPSYMRLDRSFAKLNQSEESHSVGLNLEQGLEVYWSFRHLSWQILGQYTLYDNQWTPSAGPVGLLSLSSGVGLSF